MSTDVKDRTTVRLSVSLKERLEGIARSEGKTFTDLLHEAGWEWVRRKERVDVRADFELPVVQAGGDLDVEEIKRRLLEMDDAYDRRQARIAMGLDS